MTSLVSIAANYVKGCFYPEEQYTPFTGELDGVDTSDLPEGTLVLDRTRHVHVDFSKITDASTAAKIHSIARFKDLFLATLDPSEKIARSDLLAPEEIDQSLALTPRFHSDLVPTILPDNFSSTHSFTLSLLSYLDNHENKQRETLRIRELIETNIPAGCINVIAENQDAFIRNVLDKLTSLGESRVSFTDLCKDRDFLVNFEKILRFSGKTLVTSQKDTYYEKFLASAYTAIKEMKNADRTHLIRKLQAIDRLKKAFAPGRSINYEGSDLPSILRLYSKNQRYVQASQELSTEDDLYLEYFSVFSFLSKERTDPITSRTNWENILEKLQGLINLTFPDGDDKTTLEGMLTDINSLNNFFTELHDARIETLHTNELIKNKIKIFSTLLKKFSLAKTKSILNIISTTARIRDHLDDLTNAVDVLYPDDENAPKKATLNDLITHYQQYHDAITPEILQGDIDQIPSSLLEKANLLINFFTKWKADIAAVPQATTTNLPRQIRHEIGAHFPLSSFTDGKFQDIYLLDGKSDPITRQIPLPEFNPDEEFKLYNAEGGAEPVTSNGLLMLADALKIPLTILETRRNRTVERTLTTNKGNENSLVLIQSPNRGSSYFTPLLDRAQYTKSFQFSQKLPFYAGLLVGVGLCSYTVSTVTSLASRILPESSPQFLKTLVSAAQHFTKPSTLLNSFPSISLSTALSTISDPYVLGTTALIAGLSYGIFSRNRPPVLRALRSIVSYMTPNLTTLAAATLPFAYDAIFNTNHCISALTSLIPHCYTAAIGSGIAGLGLGLGLMAKRYIKIPNAISSRAKSAKRVITGFPQSFMENLKTQKWYSTKEFIKGAFLPERKLLNQTWQNKSYLYKIPLAILSVPWKGIKLLA